MQYKGTEIAVVGCGKSGVAAARFAARRGASVTVFDSGDGESLREQSHMLESEGIACRLGPAALNVDAAFVSAVLSPGIDPSWDIAQAFSTKQIPLLSEIEFGFRSCKRPVVAITGTNGKTTTTELAVEILKANGVSTVAAGNYGVAFCEVIDDETDYDLYTLELSSFQLELISEFQAESSVWMNFAADHLDRHPSMEAYRAAKLRIFENQTPENFAIVNGAEDYPPISASTMTFSAYMSGCDFVLEEGKILHAGREIIDYSKTQLRGTHNAENLMAAMALAHTRGIEFADMVEAASAYRPPRHRCELVAIVGGHEFINDSKATNLHALESSLRSQPEKVVLIVGGKDKGLDFSPVADIVAERCSHVVTIGQLREHLAATFGESVPQTAADSLEEAVGIAYGEASATPGRTVLFSPGTSSFDMFRGYEDRGDVFCASVNQLMKR